VGGGVGRGALLFPGELFLFAELFFLGVVLAQLFVAAAELVFLVAVAEVKRVRRLKLFARHQALLGRSTGRIREPADGLCQEESEAARN
jgi:hypothetical protein